jgi:uncharacterized protein YgfB (UPF0149 family)
MNTQDWFDPLSAILLQAGVRHSPAELHGVICGLLSTGVAAEDAELCGLLASHTDLVGQWPADAVQAFAALRDMARDGLLGGSMDLVLCLPDDEAALSDRVGALGQWAEGFLVGFGTGTAGMKDSDFPPSLQEALSDLSAISQVDLPEDDSTEEADLFEQVAEHTRMAALMVFTELVMRDKAAAQEDNEGDKPITH